MKRFVLRRVCGSRFTFSLAGAAFLAVLAVPASEALAGPAQGGQRSLSPLREPAGRGEDGPRARGVAADAMTLGRAWWELGKSAAPRGYRGRASDKTSGPKGAAGSSGALEARGYLSAQLPGSPRHLERKAAHFDAWSREGRRALGADGGGAGFPLGACESCLEGNLDCGAAVAGDLGSEDCLLGDGSLFDVWSLRLETGGRVRLDLRADEFNAFLILADDNCRVLALNDDCTPQASPFPVGVAVVGGEVFVGDLNAPVLRVYSRDGVQLRTVSLPYPVAALGGDEAENRLFAVPFAAGEFIAELGPADGSEVRRLPSPEPLSFGPDALAFGGGSLYYLGGFGSDTLWELDPESGAVRDSDPVTVGSGDFDGLAVLGGRVWILDYGFDSLHVFNPANDTVERTLDVGGINPGNDFIGGLAGASGPDAILATGNDPSGPKVFEIDPESGVVTSSFSALPADLDFDSCLELDLPAGDYFVAANSLFAGQSGAYQLEAACTEILECRNCSTESVACGETKQSTLSGQECVDRRGSFQDYFRFEIAESGRVRIDMTSAAFDTFLWLHDASCVPIAVNDDSGGTLNSLLIQDLDAGTYFVGASSFAGGATGDYTLAVACMLGFRLCDDCQVGPANCGETVEASLGASGCTALNGLEIDMRPLALAADGPVTLRLESPDFDTFLYLYDSSCELVAANDDCRGSFNSCLENLELAAGTYSVGVSSFAGVPGLASIGGIAGIQDPDAILATASSGEVVEIDPASGNVTRAFPHAASFAVGLAAVGGRIFVGDLNVPELEVYDRAGTLERTVALPYTVSALAGDGGSRLFAVPADGSFAIVELDPQSGAELRRFAAPEATSAGPDGLAFDGARLFYINGFGSRSVFELDPSDGRVLDSDFIGAGTGNFDGLAALRGLVYVLDYGQSALLVFDPETDMVTATRPIRGERRARYTLSVSCPDVRFCRECAVGRIGCGEPVTDRLDGASCRLEDQSLIELWRLDLADVSVVDFSLRSAEFAPVLALLDASCQVLAQSGDCAGGAGACLGFRQLNPGVYYVGVTTAAAGQSGAYDLSVSCGAFDACGSCIVGEIPGTGEVEGFLDAVDCQLGNGSSYEIWRLHLDAGRRVSVRETSSDVDPLLFLVDSGCFALAASDTCGDPTSDACVGADLPAGDYFVVASSTSPARGAYRLSVTVTEIPLCRDCVIGDVLCDQTVLGRLPVSNCRLANGSFIDVYRFALAADGTVDIRMRSPEFDTFLFVYGSDCGLLAANDDCEGLNSCLTLSLQAGEYFVGASTFAPGAVGSYSLVVTCAGSSKCSGCEVGQLACGSEVTGSLAAGSCPGSPVGPADFWRFEVDAPRRVELALRSQAFDSVLTLFDGNCLALATNDDCAAGSRDSCIAGDLKPGTYFVRVSGRNPRELGPYTLAAVCPSGGQIPGDCTQDGRLDISDGICLLGFLFLGRPVRLPCGDGSINDVGNRALMDPDANGGRLNIADAVYLFQYLFLGGPPHVLGTGCVPITGCETVCAPE